MYNIKQEVVITTTKKNGDIQEIKKKLHLFGFGKVPMENLSETEIETDFEYDDVPEEELKINSLKDSAAKTRKKTEFLKRKRINKLGMPKYKSFGTNFIENPPFIPHPFTSNPIRLISTKHRGKEYLIQVNGDEIIIIDKHSHINPVRSRMKFD